LSEILTKDLSNENMCDSIIESILECILSLPVKTAHYATLIGNLSLTKNVIGEKFSREIKKQFEASMKAGNWILSKLCVKIFAELTNAHVVHVDTLIKLYKTLMTFAMTVEFDARLHVSFMYLIVATLPNCHVLRESNPEEFDEILKFTYRQFEKRKGSQSKSFAFVKRDWLDSMWNQLQSIKDWQTIGVFRPYLKFEKLMSHETVSDQFSDFVIPSQDEIKPFSRNRIGLRLEKDPNMEPIDEFILEEHINDILFFYYKHSHDDCAQALIQLCQKTTTSLILIDIVLSNLFLQKPILPKLYFETILYDFTKFDKRTTLMLIKYIDSVFILMDDLAIDCYDRFVEFFGFLLAQVNYQWVWGNWATVLKTPNTTQYRFLVDVFHLLKRECQHSTLKHLTPQEFHGLIGSAPIPAEITSKEVIKLANLFWEEKPSTEVEFLIQDGKFSQLQLFQGLLLAGKTFSHLMNILSRHQMVFVSHSSNKVELLDLVFSHWNNSNQWIQICIEKWIEFKILSLRDVVEYFVSKGGNLDAKWIRDIVCLMLSKSISKDDYLLCQNTFNKKEHNLILTKIATLEQN
jgi:hypothetical protein